MANKKRLKTCFPTALLLAMLCVFFPAAAKTENALPSLEALKKDPLLPVLAFQTENGALPTDEDSVGTLCIYDTDGSVLRVRMEIRLRGNTSRRFSKQSYRVKIIDEEGNKRNVSMAGLRADDDWILNPMYSDTSKIREAVSYWLWDQINSCGQAAQSTHLAYAEVFFNGQYHGLYALEERVDRKQVHGDKARDILYKIIANDQPSVEELTQAAGDVDVCRGIELAFCGSKVADPWLPAADYMALLTDREVQGWAQLSPANTVDYGLWSMLTQARDCHFKNQFIHAAHDEGGYTLYRIPWDVNHTLGDLWNGNAEEQNYTDYAFLSLTMDDVFQKKIAEGERGFLQSVQERWRLLRDERITEEGVMLYAQTLHDSLYPAIERDALRWPACGMGEGNAANIRDIASYFAHILPRMDDWAQNLIETMEEMELGHGKNLDP